MVATNFSTLPDGFQFLSLFDQAFAQCVSNGQSRKTGAYAVQPTDSGTIILAGNSFYSLTASAASGFGSTFAVIVLNEDTGRGKTITINGITSFILWPLQSFILLNDNGAWQILPRTQRWQAPGGVTLNVDPVLGSDSNDGLATGVGNALLTTQAALNILLYQVDCRGGAPTILLANGTYSGSAALVTGGGAILGNTEITIKGNAGQAASVLWQVPASGTAIGFFIKDYLALELDNMTISGASGTIGIQVGQFGILDVGPGVVFGSFSGGTHISIFQGGSGNAVGSYSIAGSANFHLLVQNDGQWNFGSTAPNVSTGLTFTYFVLGLYGASINASSVSFAGGGVGTVTTATKFLMQYGSNLETQGTDPNTIFPGNTNGQVQLGVADGLVSNFSSVAFLGLPAHPQKGMVIVINDSTTNTWGAPVTTGGGADIVLGWYNGSAWTVFGK